LNPYLFPVAAASWEESEAGQRAPPKVLFYVGVPDVDAALKKEARLGGARHIGPPTRTAKSSLPSFSTLKATWSGLPDRCKLKVRLVESIGRFSAFFDIACPSSDKYEQITA
jgi:hypothetical protein